MIGLLLIAGAVLGWWAWKTRDARAPRIGDVAAAIAALIALRLFTRGEAPPALMALGGAGWWAWFRRSGGGTDAEAMSREEARGLLGVSPDAGPETIRAAYRRIVTRVHPDVGGSNDLTARVNAARDVLLARR